MKNKKIIGIVGLVGLAACLLPACKPTESNYKAAYDKAAEAAERRNREMNTGTDGKILESMDAPRIQVIDGDTVMVSAARMRVFEESEQSVNTNKNIGVAVARYTMPTNARRHVEELRKEYPEALIVTDGDGNFYVVTGRYESLPEAASQIKRYRANHAKDSTIGLPLGPLAIYIR